MNFDFHPQWMEQQFQAAGFDICEQYAVSHFRQGALKRRFDPNRLARFDAALFGIGGRYPVSPSVFVQAQLTGTGANLPARVSTDPTQIAGLFRCPSSGSEAFEQVDEDLLYCPDSGLNYARRGGVWDFKEPVT